MKRILSLILALALVLSVLSCAVFAEETADPVPQSALQQASAQFEQSVQELGATILDCTGNILAQGGLTVMTGTMLLASKATQQIAQWSVDYYQKQLDEKKPGLEEAKAPLNEIDNQIKTLKTKLKWTYKAADKAALQAQIDALEAERVPYAEVVDALQAEYDKIDRKLNGTAMDGLVRSFLSGDFKNVADAGIKLVVELLAGKITKDDISGAYTQFISLRNALTAFAAIGAGEINQENIQTILNAIRNLDLPVATRKAIIDSITELLGVAYQGAKGALGTAFQDLVLIPEKIWDVAKSFGNVVVVGFAS